MIKELTAQEVELVSGGDDWAIGAFTAGTGAALAGTLALVPRPHVPVAAAISATFGLMALGMGAMSFAVPEDQMCYGDVDYDVS